MIRNIIVVFAILVPSDLLALNGAEIKIGESQLTPELQLIYFQDDNVFATSDETVEDSGYLIIPTLEWSANKGLTELSLNYKGEIASHSDESRIDYSDHDLSFRGYAEFSSRSRLLGVLRHSISHEAPGTGRSRDLDSELNGITDFNDTGFSANYSYGAKTAKGGLEFGLEYANRDYQNNSEVTDGFSFSRLTPSVEFLYAISADTRLTTGLEYSVFDYEKAQGITESDNDTYFVFVGAKWDITGKSGGSLRIGYGGQNNKSNLKEDQTTSLLRLGTYWQPVSYSRFNLDAERSFSVDSITPSITNTLLFNWSHTWSERIFTQASFSRVETESDSDEDENARDTTTLGINLKLRRWIDLNLIGKNTANSSPNKDDEFDKQWIGFGVTGRL